MRTQGIREEESGYSNAGVVSSTMSCSRQSSLSSSSTSSTFAEHYHVLSQIILINVVINIIYTCWALPGLVGDHDHYHRHRDQHHQHHEYCKGEEKRWRSGELRSQPAELSLRQSRSSAGWTTSFFDRQPQHQPEMSPQIRQKACC